MFSFGLGQCVRAVPGSSQQIFLSFDDGPDPRVTPALLDILQDFDSHATFFVIGEKARRFPLILERVVQEGHAIGDHSWDHQFHYFFQSKKKLKAWIERGQSELKALLGEPAVGFRPPAGVVTPPLQAVLRELGIPLILWNRRFFDTVRVFTPHKAPKVALQMRGGDILLFHDGRCPNPEVFLTGIGALLSAGKARGLEFRALKKKSPGE